MMHEPYRQVVLHLDTRRRVAWIPAYLAVLGRFVKLCGENGWQVTWVGKKMDGDWVRDRSNDYRYQRRMSDA